MGVVKKARAAAMCRENWLLLVLVAVLSSGCATIPTKQLDAFAESTHGLASSIRNTDTRIEQLAARHAVDVANPDKPITSTTFEPISPVGQSYDISDDLRYQELVFSMVSEYAGLLKAFGEGDSGADIDKASTALGSSLKALAATADPADKRTPTYSGLAATIVDVGGRALTDYMRQRALVAAMTKAQPDLEHIASTYSKNLYQIGKYVDIMQRGFVARANALRPRVRKCREGGRTLADKACFRGRREDELARMKADTDTATLLKQVKQVKDSLASIKQATSRIPKANEEILHILQGSPTGEEAVEQLVADVKQANSFFGGLK